MKKTILLFEMFIIICFYNMLEVLQITTAAVICSTPLIGNMEHLDQEAVG